MMQSVVGGAASTAALQVESPWQQLLKHLRSSSQGHGSSSVALPRLILHVDVNRTLIQIDPAGGKSLSDILNTNLTGICYGDVERDSHGDGTATQPPAQTKPRWVPRAGPLDADSLKTPPRLSFGDFVDQVLVPKPAEELKSLPAAEAEARWKQITAARRSLKNVFTNPGNPGEQWRPEWEKMLRALKKPSGTGDWYVIPSFWNMVNALSDAEWPFTVVFRTFGSDLPEIIEEWEHFVGAKLEVLPRGPLLKQLAETYAAKRELEEQEFQRRKSGEADTSVRSEEQVFRASLVPTGSVYRNHSGTFLQWGPTKAPKLSAGSDQVPAGYKAVSAVQLYHAITEAASALTEANGIHVVGLVDFYPWWSAHQEHPSAGKVFPLLSESSLQGSKGGPEHTPQEGQLPFQVFFDDNIFWPPEEESIVDIRCAVEDRFISDIAVQRSYLVKVEPYEAILDPDYFLNGMAHCVMQQNHRRQLFGLSAPLGNGTHCQGK
jgi:hypothetical protein